MGTRLSIAVLSGMMPGHEDTAESLVELFSAMRGMIEMTSKLSDSDVPTLVGRKLRDDAVWFIKRVDDGVFPRWF